MDVERGGAKLVEGTVVAHGGSWLLDLMTLAGWRVQLLRAERYTGVAVLGDRVVKVEGSSSSEAVLALFEAAVQARRRSAG